MTFVKKKSRAQETGYPVRCTWGTRWRCSSTCGASTRVSTSWWTIAWLTTEPTRKYSSSTTKGESFCSWQQVAKSSSYICFRNQISYIEQLTAQLSQKSYILLFRAVTSEKNTYFIDTNEKVTFFGNEHYQIFRNLGHCSHFRLSLFSDFAHMWTD